MDARLSAEQVAVREVAEAIARGAAVTGFPDLAVVDRTRAWNDVCHSGLLGMIGSDTGAGGVIESSLVAEAFGRALAPISYVTNGVLPRELLAAAGADVEASAVEAGDLRCSVLLTRDRREIALHDDPTGRIVDVSGVSEVVAIRRDGDQYRVVKAELVDYIEIEGANPAVTAASPGDLSWREVGTRPLSEKVIDRIRLMILTLMAADSLGVMRGSVDRSLEQARGRECYGVPIGQFQAIQHLLAESHALHEGTSSTVLHAAWSMGHPDRLESEEAVLVAATRAADAGQRIVEVAMQVHGGMGQTWEHFGHIALRRVMFNSTFLGQPRAHLLRIADLVIGA